jgi:hypothetical protein
MMVPGIYGLRQTEEYDPATDRWRERAPMPRGLHHVEAVALDGKTYAVVGLSVRDTYAARTTWAGDTYAGDRLIDHADERSENGSSDGRICPVDGRKKIQRMPGINHLGSAGHHGPRPQ